MSDSSRVGKATDPASSPREARLAEALKLMQQALTLIDQADGPGDVGAHLDLTIARLTELIRAGEA